MASSHDTPAPAGAADAGRQTLPLPDGPIIVATGGGPESDAAIIAARLIATRTGAPVEAVASRDGDPAPSLARMAHERRARLLVLGRGRHGVVDRLLKRETVLRVLQLADVPVLAAEAGLTALPRRLLVATDFSPYSLYAARVALSLADPEATLYLAHVALDREPLRAAFDRVRGQIGIEGMRVQTVVLGGSPGWALSEFAGGLKVDLVVSGTHGYGFFNRLALGSVATDLVRGAPCSVLIVPGSAAARAATDEQVRARRNMGDSRR